MFRDMRVSYSMIHGCRQHRAPSDHIQQLDPMQQQAMNPHMCLARMFIPLGRRPRDHAAGAISFPRPLGRRARDGYYFKHMALQ